MESNNDLKSKAIEKRNSLDCGTIAGSSGGSEKAPAA